MSRERLAAIADTSLSTVTRLELEGRVPNALTLARIAGPLDLSLDSLLAPAGAEVSA